MNMQFHGTTVLCVRKDGVVAMGRECAVLLVGDFHRRKPRSAGERKRPELRALRLAGDVWHGAKSRGWAGLVPTPCVFERSQAERRAWSKSSMMSSMCSIPTDTRTRSDDTPDIVCSSSLSC